MKLSRLSVIVQGFDGESVLVLFRDKVRSVPLIQVYGLVFGSELGIKPSTLTGWRRRGWVQAMKLGRRWIYWADDIDLPRLRKLAAHPPCGSTPAAAISTT